MIAPYSVWRFSNSLSFTWYQIGYVPNLRFFFRSRFPDRLTMSASSSDTTSSTVMATGETLIIVIAPPLTQAIHVASVKTHVSMCVNFKASNYSKWKTFSALLGKYNILRHITIADPPPGDSAWPRQDFPVSSWIYASISEEILDVIIEPNQSVCSSELISRTFSLLTD